ARSAIRYSANAPLQRTHPCKGGTANQKLISHVVFANRLAIPMIDDVWLVASPIADCLRGQGIQHFAVAMLAKKHVGEIESIRLRLKIKNGVDRGIHVDFNLLQSYFVIVVGLDALGDGEFCG